MSFYEKYFQDETKEDSSRFLGHQTFHVTNDKMKEGIEKIESYSDRHDMPVSQLATYCFKRLLSTGLGDLMSADYEIHGQSSDIYKRYAQEGDDTLIKKAENEYEKPANKLKAAKIIAENYDVGQERMNVVETNLNRIKERNQEFEDIINTKSREKAKKDFEELMNIMEEEKEDINREMSSIETQVP